MALLAHFYLPQQSIFTDKPLTYYQKNKSLT